MRKAIFRYSKRVCVLGFFMLIVNVMPTYSQTTEIENLFLFVADDGVHGKELWRVDDAGNIEIVLDINPGIENSSPQYLNEFDGRIYFVASGPLGQELYVTDGTAAGTQLVADINPGPAPDHGQPLEFTEFDGRLYFQAHGADGVELYVTDGTTDGTVQFLDINPGPEHSAPGNFKEFGGRLYFHATDNLHGRELWVTDGTPGGTEMLADINPGLATGWPSGFTQLGDKLYFSATGTDGNELYVTDGTELGTKQVKDIYPGIASFPPYTPNSSNSRFFTEFAGKLYFTADNGVNGEELWVTDGTTDGTYMVVDINLGPAFGNPGGQYMVFNNLLYFSAIGPDGRELYVSDGTEAGTHLFYDFTTSSGGGDPFAFTLFNGKMYFNATGPLGDEPYMTDGTVDGTQMLIDISPGDGGSNPVDFTVFGNKLYFRAIIPVPGVFNRRIFVSDGTSVGTQTLADIYPGPVGLQAFGFSFERMVGPPIITSVVGDGLTMSNNATLNEMIDEFGVTFSEALKDYPELKFDNDDASNSDNYLLLSPGPNGVFNTISCNAGITSDDVQFVLSVAYDAQFKHVDIDVDSGFLPTGNYRLYICGTGTTRIRDLDNNALAGMGNGVSGNDFLLKFTVDEMSANSVPVRNLFVTLTPTLSWNPVTDAAGYEIQVDNNPNFSSLEYEDKTIAAGITSKMIEVPEDGRYYWRVRALRDGNSPGRWSAVDTFFVDTP